MRSLLIFILICIGFLVRAQDQLVYQSKNLPKSDTVWVFKPKSYQDHKKLALIYLLHGYGGNYKQWNSIMDAQKYADEYGFIIVCPDGLHDSWYINSPVKKNWQYETFFFDELYLDIKKKYKVDEQRIFISGLSMGGHGALSFFIKRPDLFASAGSTSGGVKLRDFSAKYGLSNLLGNPSSEDPMWDAYSVVPNIHKLKGISKPFIFDCGSDDFFYDYNNELKQKCDEFKLKATYISQPGAHNRAYWSKSIRQQFEFFKSH
ncbi:MAG: alpha/beta hydrolase family protein [Pedobacter sp.]|uniref:alpha/beta hydrolase n=1 Tax=Pedobacter sp. TaxID=1411316 RepID=UPI002806D061|nr:alpha/beta hydrolase family protein [Pedobacter sp.]MDQ8005075.1 alpha/beta hydrolase family protein [Pedobacter sp.]